MPKLPESLISDPILFPFILVVDFNKNLSENSNQIYSSVIASRS